MGFSKILSAIDYSPLSSVVFAQTLDLAKTNRAQIMLFHCISAENISGSSPLSGELGLLPRIVNQAYQAQQIYLEQRAKDVQELLSQYCQSAAQQGIKAEFNYQIADAGRGLCQAAQQWQADLIVLGRRGRRGLTEVLLGSVSNYVLHYAPCAVLVIQPTRSQLPIETHMTPVNHSLDADGPQLTNHN